MALAFSGSKQGLDSQMEIEAILWQWEHQILTTRPEVSDKGPGSMALQKRISTKMKTVQYIWRDTQADSEGKFLSHALVELELLLCNISSVFPLANNFDLPQSIFGASQDPPKCAHALLSQDEFYYKSLWVAWHKLVSLTFDL